MVQKTTFLSELHIGCWNINGIFKRINGFRYNKLHDNYILGLLQNHHIFGFIESHHMSSEIHELNVNGFICFNACRPKKMQKGSKVSGGLSVYVRDYLRPGVQKIPRAGSESICLKLKKDFFSLKNDIFLVFSYCGPSNSQVLQRAGMDVYDDLNNLLAQCADSGDIILTGDLNARVGQLADYIEGECNDHVPVPSSSLYSTDTVAVSPRNTMDGSINSYGHKLVELCQTVPLRILNGRKLGDLLGNFTCYTARGSSVVDYTLASPSLFNKIPSFCVGDYIPVLSDHAPIHFKIQVRAKASITDQTSQLSSLPDKVTWDKEKAERYEILLQSPSVKEIFSSVVSQGVVSTQQSIDATANLFSDILVKTACAAEMSIKRGSKPKPSRSFGFVKVKPPKWHDKTCFEMFASIKRTSNLLMRNPRDPWLKGKLNKETKQYNQLLKKKQSQFVNKIFNDLEIIEEKNPKGYYDLIDLIRSGGFDKTKPNETDSVDPITWFTHFKDLLGQQKTHSKEEEELISFVNQNKNEFISELDDSFSDSDVMQAIKSLKNGKSSSFDIVTNEMLKHGANSLSRPLAVFFNAVFNSNLYPSQWKLDILGPLHKSGPLEDPNNFRGICVSSCLGKLFNTLIRQKLDAFCIKHCLINKYQGSGKKKSRTADHLMVLRYIIDHFVKGEQKIIYACFYDLQKAFDNVNRPLLFYNLLVEYKIGGKFLSILENIYTDNQIFVKVGGGLTEPFTTTKGVKQGCVLSPCLFNLFINKIPDIYDDSCDLLSICGTPLPVLMWADDLVTFSHSAQGLKNSINKTKLFFDKMHLVINTKKTKVMIFNKGGKLLNKSPEHIFYCGDNKIEVVDQYKYLGVIIKPSGTFTNAVNELHTKASKAWFSISNFIYQNKRMPVTKALKIFDALVVPISLYCSELISPFLIPENNFSSLTQILSYWEQFKPELLNQKVSRMILSVHKKASRLATLGELGRYPLFLIALKNAIKYEYSLRFDSQNNSDTLVSLVYRSMEISSQQGKDCWLDRVTKIKSNFGINLPIACRPEAIGPNIKKVLFSKFEKFWIETINKVNLDKHGKDRNKLRFYKTFKGCFKREPYIDLVKNRNQRCHLTRMRTSCHTLAVETGRYQTPYVAPEMRICKYCVSETGSRSQDNELHFLLLCPTFKIKRNCYFGKLKSIGLNLTQNLSNVNLLSTLLCPTDAKQAKLTNKFIDIMFKSRKLIDEGATIEQIQTYPNPATNLSEMESVSEISFDSLNSSCSISDTGD